MAVGVTADLVWERDRALRRLQVLAAEIRVHEDSMRRQIASPPRPADERLYRRLRQVNDGEHDQGQEVLPPAPMADGARRRV